jgi:hypothetical protein
MFEITLLYFDIINYFFYFFKNIINVTYNTWKYVPFQISQQKKSKLIFKIIHYITQQTLLKKTLLSN